MDKFGKGLVGRILGLSGKETSQIDAVIGEYYLDKLVEGVCSEVNPSADGKRIPLIVELDENIPLLLQGEDNIIAYVLKELLIYAIKDTEAGYVKLLIQGTALEDKADLLFSLKYTGKRTKDIVKGDISRLASVLESIGSNLVSEYNGQCCELNFNLSQTIIKKHRNILSDGERVLDILVIDDDSINVSIFKALLKKFKVNIYEGYSGAECLEMLEKMKYDIVFLDHMMPDMDGIDTLRMHGKNDNSLNKDTPIIALTANAEEGAEEEYLREGFSGYLSKPIAIENLVGIIDENCR